MARETYEETGIVVDPADLSVVHVMHRAAAGSGGERVDFFLSARRWSGQPTIGEPDKCDELSWHRLEDLPANTVPYVAAALDACRSSCGFSEYGWGPVPSRPAVPVAVAAALL
jgi:8-oxo-dGTP pyrophosphatase MutT (NUDIX family)